MDIVTCCLISPDVMTYEHIYLHAWTTPQQSYKEKDAGKVVLYTTSLGIVRDTYAKCANVKQILRTSLVKFEERDVFMSSEYQQEIKDRMQSGQIQVPQLYVDGQLIGVSALFIYYSIYFSCVSHENGEIFLVCKFLASRISVEFIN